MIAFLLAVFALMCFEQPVTADKTAAMFKFTTIPLMWNYLCIMLFPSFALNIVSEDMSCGWDKFSCTFPLKKSALYTSRVISAAIVTAICTALPMINAIIAAVFLGGNAELCIAVTVCFAMMEFISIVYAFIFDVRYGSTKAAGFIYLGIEIVFAAAAITAAFGSASGDIPFWMIRIIMYAVLPALTVFSAVIGTRVNPKHED